MSDKTISDYDRTQEKMRQLVRSLTHATKTGAAVWEASGPTTVRQYDYSSTHASVTLISQLAMPILLTVFDERGERVAQIHSTLCPQLRDLHEAIIESTDEKRRRIDTTVDDLLNSLPPAPNGNVDE
jgi:hypothetical protein